MYVNPSKTKHLKRAQLAATLAGGQGGHDDKTPEASSAFHAEESQDLEATLATLLAALLDMWDGYQARNRKELDAAYETLVTELEVLRDGVPKA